MKLVERRGGVGVPDIDALVRRLKNGECGIDVLADLAELVDADEVAVLDARGPLPAVRRFVADPLTFERTLLPLDAIGISFTAAEASASLLGAAGNRGWLLVADAVAHVAIAIRQPRDPQAAGVLASVTAALADHGTPTTPLANRVMTAIHHDRTLTAAVIHAGSTQMLTRAAHLLEDVAIRANGGEDTETLAAAILTARTAVREACASLRHELTSLISPPDDFEAGPDLHFDIRRLLTRHAAQLSVDLSVTGEVRPLSGAVHAMTYHFLDEALANVVRHSSALNARVKVHYDNRSLDITVADDGEGVNRPEANGAFVSQGQRILDQLAAHVGARVSLRSVAGIGTTVTLTAPIAPAATAGA